MTFLRRFRLLAPLVLALALMGAACSSSDESSDTTAAQSGDSDEKLVVYSGRDEELVQPLIDKFAEETGITVDVKYGNSAEMGAQLLEEGDKTPADVFLTQEVGAAGVLANAGLLSELPTEVVETVEPRFRPGDGNNWVGVTGRARVIVYNPELVAEADVPAGVLDLTDPKYKGDVAWVPSNAGFQAFITGFRASEGDEAASKWLDGMIANEPQVFEKNGEVLTAVNEGRVPMGLINHYYWAREAPELGDALVAKLVFPEGEDPGGLVNATAVAITKKGESNPASLKFVEFLLSEEGQTYFVEETYEYPVASGIKQPEGVPPLSELQGPQIDLTDLESLEATQALLTEKGLLN